MVPRSSYQHPVFDKFPFDQNFECPWSEARIAEYQKRIDKIAGKSANGRSNVRLIWPASTDESISMRTVNGEKKARYRLWTNEYQCTRTDSESGLEVVEHIDVDITPPRFMFEEFHEAAEDQFNPGPINTRGAGYYTHLFTVGEHDEHCCGGREARKGKLCLGLYREPSEKDLDNLRQRIRYRDAQAHGHRAGERISQEEYAEDVLRLKNWIEQRDNHIRDGFLEAATSALQTHGWNLFNFDHGKKSRFHFLTDK